MKRPADLTGVPFLVAFFGDGEGVAVGFDHRVEQGIKLSNALEVILDQFAAELTIAAYPVALRHGVGAKWLDLELDLWRTFVQTVKKWDQANLETLPRSKVTE